MQPAFPVPGRHRDPGQPQMHGRVPGQPRAQLVGIGDATCHGVDVHQRGDHLGGLLIH